MLRQCGARRIHSRVGAPKELDDANTQSMLRIGTQAKDKNKPRDSVAPNGVEDGGGDTASLDEGEDSDDGSVEVELSVTGMKCDGCKSSVENALAAVDGVTWVEVDLDNATARVGVRAPTAMDALQQSAKLCDAVASAGFEAEPVLG